MPNTVYDTKMDIQVVIFLLPKVNLSTLLRK